MKRESWRGNSEKHFWLSSQRLKLDCCFVITVSVTPGVHAKHRAGENSFASFLVVPKTPDKMRLNNQISCFDCILSRIDWKPTERCCGRHTLSPHCLLEHLVGFFLCLWNWINSSQCANRHTEEICKCTSDTCGHKVTPHDDHAAGSVSGFLIASSYSKTKKLEQIKLIRVQEVKALLWK